jgi:enterochelin esterase family protein
MLNPHLVCCLSIIALAGLVRGADEAPFQSAEVQPDGRITFRLRDPGAAKVEVGMTGIAGNLHMTKDSAGVWSATTPALAPEMYWYSFWVDGRAQLDPQNRSIAVNLVSPSSLVTVPGATPRLWELQPVPHGEVHHHFYTTSIVKGLPGNQSDYYVYTPPGYDPSAPKPYPVLYLLHGFSDIASAWQENGRANFILDNLIAQGRARPMVVVMPLGYTSMPPVTDGLRINKSELKGDSRIFGDVLLKEVVPRVEAEYRVSRDRADRAIAGLSMGGAESLRTGLNHPGSFAWVGGFSSGRVKNGDYDAVFPGLDSEKADLRLLWISCGTRDGLLKDNREFATWLAAKGFAVTEVELPGAPEWAVWHESLIRFAQLVFQEKRTD